MVRVEKSTYWTLLMTIIIALNGTSILSQNLILDGNFEVFKAGVCQSPEMFFDDLEHWYVLNGSPDLFKNDCNYDDNGLFFWDTSLKSYEGTSFVGISSRWNSNETYVSEGLATRFTDPLQAGQLYFIQIVVRNRGLFEGLSSDFFTCQLDPDKHLDIYISKDSIQVINDFSNGTAMATGDLAVVFSNSELNNAEEGEWTVLSGCFMAKGGEQFIGITMPQGTFGELPPCTFNLTSGIFQTFYYNLDQVSIVTLPPLFEEKISICEGESLDIDFTTILDPVLLEDAEFIWSDGKSGLTRSFASSGIYPLVVYSSCGSVSIELEVETRNCGLQLFVPNAFSPNDDGNNDSFGPYITEVERVDRFSFNLFDRWGNQIFFTSDPNERWDGTFRGKRSPEGTYLWSIDYEISNVVGPQRITKTGSLLLIN